MPLKEKATATGQALERVARATAIATVDMAMATATNQEARTPFPCLTRATERPNCLLGSWGAGEQGAK